MKMCNCECYFLFKIITICWHCETTSILVNFSEICMYISEDMIPNSLIEYFINLVNV